MEREGPAGRLLGRGPQGAPAGDLGRHGADTQYCLPPAASFRRRRLARRPGYMRSSTEPGIEFLPPAVGTPLEAQALGCGEEFHHSESRAGLYILNPGKQWQSHLIGNPDSKNVTASTLASLGPLSLALTPVRRTPALFGTQRQVVSSQPITRSCGPGDVGCKRDLPPMDSSKPSNPTWDTACSQEAKETWTKDSVTSEEVSWSNYNLGSDPKTLSTLASSQDSFTSSFSFIRLSLDPTAERGEAEGCLPSREAEDKAGSEDRLHEHLRLLSQSCHLKTAQDSGVLAQAAEGNSRLQSISLLDTDTAPCSSPHSSCLEGSFSGDAHCWDTLHRKCESVLLDCLLSDQRQLEVKSLRLKLQKLQEKAIEEDDFDKAEMLKQRLEDLEKEKDSLCLQLPSRQPALKSFLHFLGAQVHAALNQAAQQQDDSENSQSPLRMEFKILGPSVQDNLHLSVTKRDWLLQEKQQLQKEIESLQARMSVLAEKDYQLKMEMEELEQLLPWQGCDLSPLVGSLSLRELQEVSKALRDTSATANQIPLSVEPPEAIRSLQERIKSFNMSFKELTAKVCMSERLCRTLRKKVINIESQLPALFEAKMSAVSGSHFGTAKELTEEIRSLISEREGLEGLLNKLAVLSSRNIKKLGNVQEDYNRLRKELDSGETDYEAKITETVVKYMDILEDKLHSCKFPLLEKVWKADLEACQLFMQSLKLQKSRGIISAEDDTQMDNTGEDGYLTALSMPSRPCPENERNIPFQESYIVSEELGGKCDAIGKKLLYLEDQLHTAIHSHDEELMQFLKRELQMVKETLHIMILQLQPAKEGGEREVAALCGTAGV